MMYPNAPDHDLYDIDLYNYKERLIDRIGSLMWMCREHTSKNKYLLSYLSLTPYEYKLLTWGASTKFTKERLEEIRDLLKDMPKVWQGWW